MKIIAFAGHGGSGRSTAAHQTVSWLLEHGYAVGALPMSASPSGAVWRGLTAPTVKIVGFNASVWYDLGNLGLTRTEPVPPYLKALANLYKHAKLHEGSADYWVKRLEKLVYFVRDQLDFLVIDDLERVIEADWVVNQGGMVVSLVRSETDPPNYMDALPHTREVFMIRERSESLRVVQNNYGNAEFFKRTIDLLLEKLAADGLLGTPRIPA